MDVMASHVCLRCFYYQAWPLLCLEAKLTGWYMNISRLPGRQHTRGGLPEMRSINERGIVPKSPALYISFCSIPAFVPRAGREQALGHFDRDWRFQPGHLRVEFSASATQTYFMGIAWCQLADNVDTGHTFIFKEGNRHRLLGT